MDTHKNNNLKILTNWLNSNSHTEVELSEKKLYSVANKNVIELFKQAVQYIPAYKDFLKKQGFTYSKVVDIESFKTVPLTTKENYIAAYPLESRCWNGTLNGMHMISTSSGTSNKPHYWPRDLRSEIEGAIAHQYIFKNVLNINTQKTLLINGFAMGNWIAGTFTQACSVLNTLKGFPLVATTPGYNLDAVLETFIDMQDNFKKIIITGHVPFLKEVVEAGVARNIDWSKNDVLILGTGQAITEELRSYLLGLLNQNSKKRSKHKIVNLYGSADAALMGWESKESVTIRSMIKNNNFDIGIPFDKKRIPSVYQFDPRLTYFEEKDNELLITKYSGAPLIRYNIHDEGGVLYHSSFLTKDKKNRKKVSLPYVYIYGREKFMVKIYGANIYAEHFQKAINHPDLQKILTGRFKASVEYDKENNSVLLFRAELKVTSSKNDKIEHLIREILISEIRGINSEFDYVLNEIGEKAKPVVILHQYQDEEYFPKGIVRKSS